MDDDKDVRKRRRRSVRNLRRQSGVLPLNLNALDDGAEAGSVEVPQSDGKKQEMYGSMWCESQEPAVKKRRRRSGLFGGLVPKTLTPAVEVNEEESKDRNNHNENSSKILEMQSEPNDMNAIIERNENEDCNNSSVRNELKMQTEDTNEYLQFCKVKGLQKNILDSVDCLTNRSLGDNPEGIKEIEVSTVNIENDTLSSELLGVDKCAEEDTIDNTSLNTSDRSSKSPANCNMSKVSPASMSPDFPMSPNATIYEDSHGESYIGMNETVEESNKGKDLEKLELTQSADASTNSVCEMIHKSPGADQISDLSHSDKENSIVNDNVTLNTTPQVKDESAENISPGFMSFCKAFAGKVVNFVRTSPSYLTGAVTDNSACASPALKGNTSLNLASNELSKFGAQSNIGNSLDKLDAEISKESTKLKSAENIINASIVGGGETKDIDNEVKDCVNMSIKSANPVTFGSAKKQRDRKTFFDTFNAVSDELKKDRRKSSSSDEAMIDKTVNTGLNQYKEQNSEQSGGSLSASKTDMHKDQKVCIDSALSQNVSNENITSRNHCTNSVFNNDIHVDDEAENENAKNAAPVDFEESGDIAPLEEFGNTFTSSPSNKTVYTELQDDKISFDEKCTNMLFKSVNKTMDMEIECTAMDSTDVGYNSGVNDITEHQREKTMTEEVVKENMGTKHAEDKSRNSETLCIDDNSHEKHEIKRQKTRTLDILKVGDNGTGLDSVIKTDVNVPKCVVKDSTFVSDDKSYSDHKLETERNKPEKVNENKSSTKLRKNRRKSFGFQSVCKTDTVVSNTVKRNARPDIVRNEPRADIKSKTQLTKDVDEVDGGNGFHAEELHLEKRVAELDLGNECAKTERENGTGSSEIDKQAFHDFKPSENKISKDSNVEKKKRGRRRKSANLNDILKKGRQRTSVVEPILELDEHMTTDENEKQNMSELTNEISQVQISGIKTKSNSEETAISVQGLLLPDDHVTAEEHKSEPKRKRRRSAEAASLKLHMMDFDGSPSRTNSPKTDNDKPRRRKCADAATLKIQLTLDDQERNCPGIGSPSEASTTVTKHGKKRKHKEESFDELEKLYRNKNFIKPEEKKPWQTILESPVNPVEMFGKKRLNRHIEFERPTQMKLRRRLQRAVKNGWDPKKRKRTELKDDYVQVKLANLWSELEEGDEEIDSLQSRLRSIVETT